MLRETVSEWKEQGIAGETHSGFTNPVLLVKKENRKNALWSMTED